MAATMRADVSSGDTLIERWQNKITNISGISWLGKDINRKYKIGKERLVIIIDELGLKAKSAPLGAAEWDATRDTDEHVTRLKRDESTRCTQRDKVKHI
jgi:hypothetical protein